MMRVGYLGGNRLAVALVVVVVWVFVPVERADAGDQATLAEHTTGGIRLAVLDFEVIGSGVDPSAGEALALVVRSALVQGGGVRLMERSELEKILVEQDLQLTDLVNPATAVRVGRLAGVQRLVLGSIAAIEGTYLVTCRVIDVTTGQAAEAEEFALDSFEHYPQLGRLLAALIGEQPVPHDSVAGAERFSETFEGPTCKLPLGGSNLEQGGASLDNGRYILSRHAVGNQYAWLPSSPGPFYVQVDLARLQGPRRSGCGLVWGASGTDDFLSIWLDGEQGLRLERRQGGNTTTAILRERGWPAINAPPKSNRVRLESWGDRHRVFINGVLVDDFIEPGYENGRIGLRVFTRQDGEKAICAADNLVYGPIDLSLAGIAAHASHSADPTVDKKNRKKAKRPRRTDAPWAKLTRADVTRQTRSGVEGLEIHAGVEVGNLKGHPLRIAVRFTNTKTHRRLKDKDGQYTNSRGFVLAVRDFTPRYRVATYSDLTVFIPLEQLHLPKGTGAVGYQVLISDPFADRPQQLARSKPQEFRLHK